VGGESLFRLGDSRREFLVDRHAEVIWRQVVLLGSVYDSKL
jgi:hypothetical protein